MASKVNGLLSKKGWTGEEVGRAVITHLIDEYTALYDPSHKSAFTVSDLERLKSSLTQEYDRKIYNRYIRLYDAILEAVNTSQAMEQQFYHGYYRLLNIIQGANMDALALSHLDYLPVVMTERQYSDISKRAQAKSAANMDTPAGIFFHAIEYYAGAFSGEASGPAPTIPKPVKDIMATMKKTPFTNAALFAELADGDGYYLFEDGSRSDEMSEDEYAAKLKAVQGESVLDFTPGTPEHTRAFLEARKKALVNRKAGLSKEDAFEAAGDSGVEWPKWIDDIELPKGGISQYEIVFGDYRNAVADKFYYDAGDDLAASFDSFKKEFPDLSNAVIAALSKHSCLAPLYSDKHRPDEELISWGELAKNKVLNYEYMTEPSVYDITGDFNSTQEKIFKTKSFDVAIIKETPFSSRNIDAEGNYKNPYSQLKTYFTRHLEGIDGGAEVYRMTLIEPALSFIYICDAIIGTAGELHGFPGLRILRPDIAAYEDKIEALNGLVILLYDRMKDYPEWEEKIATYLNLIDPAALKPSRESIQGITERLKDLDNLDKGAVPDLIQKYRSVKGGASNE